MKRFICLISIFSIVMFSSFSCLAMTQEEYDDAYAQGWDDCVDELSSETDKAYESGYDEGFYDGKKEPNEESYDEGYKDGYDQGLFDAEIEREEKNNFKNIGKYIIDAGAVVGIIIWIFIIVGSFIPNKKKR